MMFDEELSQLQQSHLIRQIQPTEGTNATSLTLRGKNVINMASNNYLGLATHPTLKQAAITAIEEYGVGSGASRLISGTLPPHMELEKAIAHFKGTPSALSFGSGYLANLALLTALGKQGGIIFADRLVHASIVDGCRLSGADFRVFPHNNVKQLETLLQQHAARRDVLIVTEGVFSMDGDLAPLPALTQLAETYQAQLVIDDAHGTGVLGATGQGSLEHFHLQQRQPFHMGTFGKAFGSSGAYIVGPQSLIDYLISTARTFLFTTAPPPASCAATIAALKILQAEPERRTRLWKNRDYVHSQLIQMGFTLTPSASPILPILIGDPEIALKFAQSLLQEQVFAPAIRPPTVPQNSSRIRLTVTSEHTPEQLQHVIHVLRQTGQKLGLL